MAKSSLSSRHRKAIQLDAGPAGPPYRAISARHRRPDEKQCDMCEENRGGSAPTNHGQQQFGSKVSVVRAWKCPARRAYRRDETRLH
jgi:hypothetical protein